MLLKHISWMLMKKSYSAIWKTSHRNDFPVEYSNLTKAYMSMPYISKNDHVWTHLFCCFLVCLCKCLSYVFASVTCLFYVPVFSQRKPTQVHIRRRSQLLSRLYLLPTGHVQYIESLSVYKVWNLSSTMRIITYLSVSDISTCCRWCRWYHLFLHYYSYICIANTTHPMVMQWTTLYLFCSLSSLCFSRAYTRHRSTFSYLRHLPTTICFKIAIALVDRNAYRLSL